jgi:hypothetical protein
LRWRRARYFLFLLCFIVTNLNVDSISLRFPSHEPPPTPDHPGWVFSSFPAPTQPWPANDSINESWWLVGVLFCCLHCLSAPTIIISVPQPPPQWRRRTTSTQPLICGLNRLNQFASFLSGHFRNARQDAKLLSMLLSLDDVLYSGLPLSQEEEQWALKSGIKLRVSFPSVITLDFFKCPFHPLESVR